MGTMTKDDRGVSLQWVDSTPAAPPAGQGTPVGSGIDGTGRSRFSTVPIGSVAYGSCGTDGVMVDGTIYIADIFIPRNFTVTGIGMLQGSVSATDKYIYALFESAGGLPVATTDLAGVIADGGTNAFLEIPLTTPYYATGPARYWIGVQCNGTTTKNRKIAASTFFDVLTTSYTGTFGTIAALTVPNSFSATKGHFSYVY